MTDIVPAHAPVRLDVQGAADLGDAAFPIRRIYCVGRNFADHAREMGAEVAASKAERGSPVFFLKPADGVVTDGVVPYPPGTEDLQMTMDVRAYRERPSDKETPKGMAQALWTYLQTQAQAGLC